ALAKQYEVQGLAMVGVHAQFEDKSISVEAGIADMLIRMETGRVKGFKHLKRWVEEFRPFHPQDWGGAKEGGALMSATRFAVMMLRFAAAPTRQLKRIVERPMGADGLRAHV